jgi:hypothetical protein
LSQVLGHGSKAVAHSAARCASQVLDRGAQVVAHCALSLSQQKKNNSEDLHRSRVNITGFFCTVARRPTRRRTFGGFELLALASRRRQRIFQQLLAPHTSGPRDVPRCGALSFLKKTPHYRGGPVETAARLNAKLWVLPDCVVVVASYRHLALSSIYTEIMNTASKLGPHTQTDRGTCPGVGL